jgi:hypothetical protein
MRRVMAMVATTILVMGGGCGSKSYEFRLDRTLENMRYRKRLDDNLMPPPAKGIAPFEELGIFLRPPKGLVQAKEFQMTVLEPGQFDLESSFFEEKKQNLHVLARVKKPKGSASKKPAAPTPADTAVRGEFNRDVVTLVGNVYGVTDTLGVEKFKEVTKKANKFKHHNFATNDKNVQVYLYKSDPYEVALIFDYPSSEQASLSSKINLALESFAVGPRAKSRYGGADEHADDEGTTEGVPGQVF